MDTSLLRPRIDSRQSPGTATHRLFVLHPQRCGSTMLRLILDAHPKVSITPEVNLFSRLMDWCPLDGPVIGRDLEKAKRFIRTDNKLNLWKIDLEPYFQQVRAYDQPTLRQIFDDLLVYYRDQVSLGSTVLGVKKGSLLRNAHSLKVVYPGAKFVYIYRDARAAVASMIKHIPNFDLLRSALTWRRRMQYARRLHTRFPDDVLYVAYEDLVREPEPILHDLCQFAGIPFDPVMLHYNQTNQQMQHILEGKEDIHPHTTEPISTAYIEKWRTDLTADQIAVIEALTGDEMVRAGYPLSSPLPLYLPDQLTIMWHRLRHDIEHL